MFSPWFLLIIAVIAVATAWGYATNRIPITVVQYIYRRDVDGVPVAFGVSEGDDLYEAGTDEERHFLDALAAEVSWNKWEIYCGEVEYARLALSFEEMVVVRGFLTHRSINTLRG